MTSLIRFKEQIDDPDLQPNRVNMLNFFRTYEKESQGICGKVAKQCVRQFARPRLSASVQ